MVGAAFLILVIPIFVWYYPIVDLICSFQINKDAEDIYFHPHIFFNEESIQISIIYQMVCFLFTELTKLFRLSGQKYFIRNKSCKCLIPIYGLCFDLIKSFWRSEVLNFNEIQCIYLSYYWNYNINYNVLNTTHICS